MIFAALPTESQAKSHATQRQATGRTDGAAYVTLNDWRTPSERPYARCVRGSADDRRRRWDAAERRRNLYRQRNGRRARRTCIGRSRMDRLRIHRSLECREEQPSEWERDDEQTKEQQRVRRDRSDPTSASHLRLLLPSAQSEVEEAQRHAHHDDHHNSQRGRNTN